MPEERLDVTQIGTTAEEMRRARVPERVRCEPDADAATVIVDACAQAVPRRAPSRERKSAALTVVTSSGRLAVKYVWRADDAIDGGRGDDRLSCARIRQQRHQGDPRGRARAAISGERGSHALLRVLVTCPAIFGPAEA